MFGQVFRESRRGKDGESRIMEKRLEEVCDMKV